MQVRTIAAITGFLAVALGAFGAHGLQSMLGESLEPAEFTQRMDWWHTATLYHLVHAPALLAAGRGDGSGRAGAAAWSFVAGVVVFSGSLYVMTLTGVRGLGAVTPLGGLALLAGWLLLLRKR